jgi:hypothetical protein
MSEYEDVETVEADPAEPVIVPAVPQFLAPNVPAPYDAPTTQFFVLVDTPANRYEAAQVAIAAWGEANNAGESPVPPAEIWVVGVKGSIPAATVQPATKGNTV